MKKILLFLCLILFIAVSALAMVSPSNPASPGHTVASSAVSLDVMDEDFEGGYDLTWVETDTGNEIDDNSTTQKQCNTSSLYHNYTGSNDSYTYHDHGTQTGKLHYRIYLYVPDTLDAWDEIIIRGQDSITPGTGETWKVKATFIASGRIRIYMSTGANTQYADYISTDAWHYVDFVYDAGTVLTWKVDGVAQTDVGTAPAADPRYFMIGTTAGDASYGIYVDAIGISTEGEIGAACY